MRNRVTLKESLATAIQNMGRIKMEAEKLEPGSKFSGQVTSAIKTLTELKIEVEKLDKARLNPAPVQPAPTVKATAKADTDQPKKGGKK